MANDKCICVIFHKPNYLYMDFLNTIQGYDIVVVIDDESEKYYEKNKEFFDTKYPRLMIAQFNYVNCIEEGFQLSNFTLNKIVSGWDKALYFFYLLYHNRIDTKNKYQHVWFIEDDVFFNDANILKNIDANYPKSDLLTKPFENKKKGEWLWDIIDVPLKEPHYNTLVCACRMSFKLLCHIFKYAETYKKLMFIEAMFPTIAMKSNLQCDFPEELNTILYRHDWHYNEMNKTNIFHPVKNIDFHRFLRDVWNSDKTQ